MKKMSLLKAMKACNTYQKSNPDAKQKIQQERLRNILTYAKENSPYYRELYKDVDFHALETDNMEHFHLTNLPTTNKVDLMAHFDEWLTDRTIKLENIEDFMHDLDNIGRKFNKEYLIFTTSGSTGNPLVSVCDATTNNVMSAVNVGRAFARKQDMTNFIKQGGKTIGVFANGGFYLSNSSVRARQLSMPWKKKQIAVTSALLPTEEIVKELNSFQPTMLGGYPSNLELLIDEQKSGRLHISPVLIMTGGEYLSDQVRNSLAETFRCYVQTSYACTEGGTLACECTEQHFHLNDDWVILEPVDHNNQPVPDGVRSDKLLVTNLYNYTQPFIRYEVTDRVIMHHEPCSCGNPAPWLQLEGRTDDVISFIENNVEIKIAPLAIYATLKEVHELRRFQLVAHDGNHIELRLEPSESIAREDAFAKAQETLIDFLKTHGVTHVEINLSSELPKQQEGSGKFKHIIRA
jgi:phenylacetate-CoA ligase